MDEKNMCVIFWKVSKWFLVLASFLKTIIHTYLHVQCIKQNRKKKKKKKTHKKPPWVDA